MNDAAWARQRWTPHRRVPAWPIVALLLVAGAVGLGALELGRRALAVRRPLAELKARPRRSLADAQPGPVVVEGKLRGPAGRTSPIGRKLAAWAAWVTVTVRSGKSSTTHTVCRRHALYGLSLRGPAGEVPVELASGRLRVLRRDPLRPVRGGLTLDLGEKLTTRKLPDVASWCYSTRKGTYRYHEVGVFDGTQVVVSGCRKDGTITSCGDGLDLIAVGGTAVIGRAWASHALIGARILGTITALCLIAAGLLAAFLHVRTQRRAGGARILA